MSDENNPLNSVHVQQAMKTIEETLSKVLEEPLYRAVGLDAFPVEQSLADGSSFKLYSNGDLIWRPVKPVEFIALSVKITGAGAEFMNAEDIQIDDRFMSENSDFMDYFTREEEYPQNVVSRLLPMNTMWWYISSSFLNGFINYVDVIDAHLLDRYVARDEMLNADSLCSYNDGEKWVTPTEPMPKQAWFELYVKSKYASNLGAFRDDILLLGRAKSEEDENVYVFFWFDHDVSDCGIGRFSADAKESEADVIRRFQKYVKDFAEKPKTYTSQPIPLSFFNGSWLSF